MASYALSKGLSQEGPFRARVEGALVNAAINVQLEDPATASHAARSALAAKVLWDPVGVAAIMALGVALPAAICDVGNAASDELLAYQVTNIWNAYAVGGA
jgi:hypothetical protein